jgi:polysaccharide pyruvyl transferase WcaK-like protein
VSPRPRFVYTGWSRGTNNLGDIAIFLAVKNIFGGGSVVDYPFGIKRGVSILYNKFGLFDGSIISGGTLINKPGRPVDMVSEVCSYCKDNFVFGTGVADPEFWSSRAVWEDVKSRWVDLLHQCGYIGVRGPRSAEILTGWGLKDVEVLGDPAVSYVSEVGGNSAIAVEKSLGINIGRTQFNGLPKDFMWGSEEELLGKYLDFAKRASGEGWQLNWFVVSPEDLEISEYGAWQAGGVVHKVYKDPREYVSQVGRMAVFVGMKLHSVVLACCAGVPSVMLEYRPKCRDFMLSIDRGELVLRTDGIDVNKLWEQVVDLSVRREEVSGEILRKLRAIKDGQIKRSNLLMEKVKGQK